MLEFTDPLINNIDQQIKFAAQEKVWQLTTEDVTSDGRILNIEGRQLINFALHSYLGLETDPRVKAAIIDAAQNFGTSYSASRAFISAPQYKVLEDLLSNIFESYPIIIPSTTLAHLAAFPILIQKNDWVILDHFAHNSVRMAAKTVAEKAKVVTVPHNDMNRLEAMIKKAQADANINNIWYLADGVYSMLGGLCPIKELNHLLEKYNNFYTYIDDAHGMSIMGKNGRGYALGSFAKQPEKMVVAVGFAKSFGMGFGSAIVLPNAEWQQKIKNCGSTCLFSGPIPTPMLSAGIALAKIHLSPEIKILQAKLKDLISYYHLLFNDGECLENEFFLPFDFIKIGSTENTIKLTKKLKEAGFFVNACIPPAVAKNSCGIRIVFSLHHTKKDIEHLVKCLQRFRQGRNVLQAHGVERPSEDQLYSVCVNRLTA